MDNPYITDYKFSIKFSNEEKAKFKIAFEMFDENGDGTIDINELNDVMKSLGKFVFQFLSSSRPWYFDSGWRERESFTDLFKLRSKTSEQRIEKNDRRGRCQQKWKN